MEPLWVRIARAEIGIKEVVGEKDHPRIIEYHSQTTLKATDDETPWCSAFINWCFYKAGIKGTRSAAARSWLNWGRELKVPCVGSVVILWRESPESMKAHVGFYMGEDKGNFFLLSGNQGNQVCIAPYSKSRLLSIRWPS